MPPTLHHLPQKRILDIGTGSGCIAISLKLRLGEAYVEAWDISEEALRTAESNAKALEGGGGVLQERDALRAEESVATWDLIVKQPAHICDSERTDMDDNVLLHEPHTALFVPDDDPLRFYRAIARYALRSLSNGGSLLFECNTRYAEATGEMMRDGLRGRNCERRLLRTAKVRKGKQPLPMRPHNSPSQPSPSGRASTQE